MRKKLTFLYQGTEVITDDLRVAVVDTHHTNERVTVRYHYDGWPFPEWGEKKRCQLTETAIEYEEAPF